ncbi:MAG: CobW family GTP-binding protein [Pseudomonadota bacterium]
MTTPVTVIGGYLGAGKTTLINAMLRQADGLRIAVLVNEFGSLPIDEDLIVAQEGDVISIAGGCICCSFGDNLVGAFTDLLALAPRPDHIVIEASGVAIPSAIAATLSLVQGVTFLGTVVLADAETVKERSRDTYMGDTIIRQLEGADIVLLSKADLVAGERAGGLEAWLKTVSPASEVLPVAGGQIPNAVVLGAVNRGDGLRVRAGEDHGALYRSIVFDPAGSVNADALADILATPALGIIRAKGIFEGEDGKLCEVQAVGARVTSKEAESVPKKLGLVCIGLEARLDVAGIVSVLRPLGLTEAA